MKNVLRASKLLYRWASSCSCYPCKRSKISATGQTYE